MGELRGSLLSSGPLKHHPFDRAGLLEEVLAHRDSWHIQLLKPNSRAFSLTPGLWKLLGSFEQDLDSFCFLLDFPFPLSLLTCAVSFTPSLETSQRR